MNEDDYVTSGKLQDYCLGLLTDEEERNVEAMCHAYPKVAKELQLLRLALAAYARDKIMTDHIKLRVSVWKAVK